MDDPKPGERQAVKDLKVSVVAGGAAGWQASVLIGSPPRPGLLGTLGDYELLECVGEGGMGVVFRARDSRSGKEVAVKLLKPALASHERAVAYFVKEARHLQGLTHPHIVSVFDCVQAAGGTYFVMPYLPGGSLERLLRSGRPLDSAQALSIARQLAAALAFAHSRSIIHRDLKPRNILLDAQGQAVLADFGLAQSLWNDALVNVCQPAIEGTPHYLSPAAARGEAEDTRSDIYAFGAVLYEMLTGQPPYSGNDRQRIVTRIQAGPPPPILALNPQANLELVAVAEGAMARELRDRYAHISYVVEDLERVAKGRPPLGSRGLTILPSPLRLSLRHLKTAMTATALRRRLAWVVGAMALLGLVALTGWRIVEARKPSLKLSQQISLPGVWAWNIALPGDLRGSGEPALFTVAGEELLAVSSAGEIVGTWRVPEGGADHLNVDLVTNVLADRKDEVLVSWRQGATAKIALLNENLFPVRKFSVRGSVTALPDGQVSKSFLRAVAVVDLDQDDRRELVAALNTGYGKAPRGLCCFDFENGTLKWQYLTGPFVAVVRPEERVLFLDIDGDGKLEVVFGSNAVDNGNQAADGTDDAHSYLYALSREGKLLWRRLLGDQFCSTWPQVLGVPGEPLPRLYAHTSRVGLSYTNAHVGHVVRLNGQGEELARYDAGTGLRSCLTGDLTGQGKPRIYAGDENGRLHVLDPDLKLERIVSVCQKRFTTVELDLIALADLDGDGHNELLLASSQYEHVSGMNPGHPTAEASIVTRHDNKLLVLNAELEVVATYLIADKWEHETPTVRLYGPKADGRYDIFCLANDARVLQFRP